MGIRFGPAGNSDSFYEEGNTASYQAPAWIAARGLDAFEYSFGRGVGIKSEAAKKIGEEAEKHGIAMSVHAPYYINLATEDEIKKKNNIRYILDSVRRGADMKAKRVIFHPAGAGKGVKRRDAFMTAKAALLNTLKMVDELKLPDITLCPETMGKLNQIGDLSETLEICALREDIIPCLDFGHLNSRTGGSLKEKSDFAAVLDEVEDVLGYDRLKRMHVHFSKIEYTAAGEKRHLTFADTVYGPEFEPLAELIYERSLEPIIICESKGTMAEDAAKMRRIYESIAKNGK
ncbi:MAG: TIM barrel protein [Christensenellales bacterium]|jgi:deoxyribonuclease-4